MDPRFAANGIWLRLNATALKFVEESSALELLLMHYADLLEPLSAKLLEMQMESTLSVLPDNLAARMDPMLSVVMQELLAELPMELALLQLLHQLLLLITALLPPVNQV